MTSIDDFALLRLAEWAEEALEAGDYDLVSRILDRLPEDYPNQRLSGDEWSALQRIQRTADEAELRKKRPYSLPTLGLSVFSAARLYLRESDRGDGRKDLKTAVNYLAKNLADDEEARRQAAALVIALLLKPFGPNAREMYSFLEDDTLEEFLEDPSGYATPR